MKKDSIIDYVGYILFRLFGPLIRNLPLKVGMFLGARLGELLYYFDLKHKAIVYANIKTALAAKIPPVKISNLTKEFYRSFGQNLIEIFFIPLINKEYINKYINIEGLEYITEGFRRGKGLILLGMHEGSWELSNIICAILGFPFSLFIGDLRHPRLDRLLNLYRRQKGCKLIQRKNQIRQLIQVLKNNEAIGMTVDQGGKDGTLVKFLGKEASMSSGAVRLALKYDVAIIPAFYTRISGPYIKIIIEPPFKIKKTQNKETDIRNNLQELVHIFEKYILKYPQEYLWSYKIWKYGKEKHILILSDGKIGHLRQSQGLAKTVSNYLKAKGIGTHIDIIQVKYKNKFARYALIFSCVLSGKYHCQGCLWCFKAFLKKDIYSSLAGIKPDIIISCGSAVAPVNFVLSRENLAKSIVVMRSSILSTNRFDLVTMPLHDHPPKRENIVVTEGALNLIDREYLDYCRWQITNITPGGITDKQLVIGLLIGGDTKNFKLEVDSIKDTISPLKQITDKLGAQVLVTTSRRTKREIEQLVKEEFKEYRQCQILIIANEKNIPDAVGGILAVSQIIITTPESISMISEAVSSQKYVLVLDLPGLGKRHQRFLRHFTQNKYIYLIKPLDLNSTVEKLWLNKPPIKTLRDNFIIAEALKKIL